jgi:hypothetical protein
MPFPSLPSLSLHRKRAKQKSLCFPATASVTPLPRGPRAHRWRVSYRRHRADLCSRRLGVVFIARSLPAIFLSLTEMVAAAFNKCAPDSGSARRSPVLRMSDLRARRPSEVGAAAAATSMRLLSSDSADVVAFAPAPLRSLGGSVQEFGRRATPACSRCWWFRCWDRGFWRAALLLYVDMVDWIERCGGPEKFGVFPGRCSPKDMFSLPAAKESKSRLVGEPSDRRLSSLVRRALVGFKIRFLLNVTA